MINQRVERLIKAADSNRVIGTYFTVTHSIGSGSYCIVMADHADNSAMSITNNAERVATTILWSFGITNPGRVIWVEYYPDRGFVAGKPQFKETFDLITFDWEFNSNGASRKPWIARRPNWRHVDRAWVEKLIGGKFFHELITSNDEWVMTNGSQ